MKNLCAAGLLLAVVGLVLAQERIEGEQAQKIARLVTEHAAKEADLAFKADIDVASPFGMKEGERAAMVLPVKNLTVDAITKAGKDVVPVGHLWFRGVTPVVKDRALGKDVLRVVKVTTDDGKEYQVPLFLVGVRKAEKGHELVFFGKGKDIVAAVPLKEATPKQDTPIEFEVKKGEAMRGTLIFNVLGKYQAELPVEAVD